MARRDTPYESRNASKAELRREGDTFVKDYAGNPYPFRLLGRWFLRREELGLRRLAGVPGIPAFLGRPTLDSIRLQAVPGTPIELLRRGDLSPRFVENLRALFRRVHARGVAHGDAHYKNILADGDTPWLIDFSMCYLRPGLPLVDGWVFDRLRWLDLERLYKVEKKFLEEAHPPKMFLLYRLLRSLKPRHRHRRKP